jgi:hypothetical protein
MPRIRILPTVKAYPVLDRVSFSEAVCVAGITMEHPMRWVRLFPLDFRGLERARQFKKYEVIEVDVTASTTDPRPETMTPRLDSIEVLEQIGSDNGTWGRRLPFFDAVEDGSMCGIQRRQHETRQSLGVFRPRDVVDLKVAPAQADFEASQRAILQQASLLGDRAGDASFRRLRDLDGKDQASCLAAVHDQFLGFCDSRHDVRFITGSMLRHPGSFLILGLVYPKKRVVAEGDALF